MPLRFTKDHGYIVVLLLFAACSPKPYANGPVMSQKDIGETFQPILDFMEVKPGMSFADVGAGSGAITVMMATLMDSSEIYIQDIDRKVLHSENLDKIITYYSSHGNADLRARNSFHLIIGDAQHTNLPEAAFDRIYTNATMHVFEFRDAMIADLGHKLKPGGMLFIRDSFKNDHKEGEFCSDPKCAKPLLTIDELLALMKRNGFKLVKQDPEMSGYPVFGFTLAN